MVDRDDVIELAPHYVAMLALAFGVLIGIRLATGGSVNFWIETGVVVLALLLYRPVVARLGLAPSMWQRR
jgi:hypothetical protein